MMLRSKLLGGLRLTRPSCRYYLAPTSECQESHVNGLTRDIFRKNGLPLRDVDNLLRKYISQMTFRNVAYLMATASRRKVKLRRCQLRSIAKRLSAVAMRSPQYSCSKNQTLISMHDIAQLMYSLYMYSESDTNAFDILEVGNSVLSTQHVVNARVTENVLYGLRNFSNDSPSVQKLLRTLSSKLNTCDDAFSGVQIGNSINGFRCMHNLTPELRNILIQLYKKLEKINANLSNSQICNALRGLQGFSSSDACVRDLLGLLSGHILRSSHPMHSVEFSEALYCLRKMRSDNVEVRDMLGILAGRIDEHKFSLDNVGMSNVVHSLQYKNPEHFEVKNLLGAIVNKIKVSNAQVPMSANLLSNAVYGIRHMTATCKEFHDLTEQLVSWLSTFEGTLNASQVGKCLLGVRNLRESSEHERELLVAVCSVVTHRSYFRHATREETVRAIDGVTYLHNTEMSSSMTLVVSKICSVCSEYFHVDDIAQIIEGLIRLDKINPDTETLIMSLVRRSKRLRTEESKMLVEKKFFDAFSRNKKLLDSVAMKNFVASLGLSKRLLCDRSS